jgi:hypothetical protein
LRASWWCFRGDSVAGVYHPTPRRAAFGPTRTEYDPNEGAFIMMKYDFSLTTSRLNGVGFAESSVEQRRAGSQLLRRRPLKHVFLGRHLEPPRLVCVLLDHLDPHDLAALDAQVAAVFDHAGVDRHRPEAERDEVAGS